MRRATVAALLGMFLASGCGGKSGPSPAPTSPTSPTTPSPSAPFWSVTGTVFQTDSSNVLPGVKVAPGWDLAPVTTDSAGNFSLSDSKNPSTAPYKLSVSGSGLVTHDIWVNWERGTRTGVRLDAIRNRAPFSMNFYRQLVRGTYDEPGAPYAVLRWMTTPNFYVKTVDQNGRAIEPEVLQVTYDAIRRAVPAWSGGRMTSPVIETGASSRAAVTGWINVVFRRDRNEHQVCGYAYIGRNPGEITLNDDVCSCGSRKVPGAVTLHEVGHAMGFFHVSDRNSIMYPFTSGDCPPGELSTEEAYHAAIAYSRPRGNEDPDSDPADESTAAFVPERIR